MPDLRPLVLLVQLPIPPPGPEPIRGNVPLAAASLQLFARRRGLENVYRIELLRAAIANELGDQGLVEEVLGRRPWMVGFTCCVWNIARTLWIAQRLVEAQPELKIVFGGPEITAPWQVGNSPHAQQVANWPHAYAVVGEGEQTFAELLAALDSGGPLDAIAGLWTRGAPAPARRKPLADLDAIASPYLEGILDATPERTMLLETARGCRYRCKYCSYAKDYDRLCFLSPDHLAASLRYANTRGVEEVFLLDPTLNQRGDFTDFLKLLARGNPQRQFSYSAELRAEGIDASTARLLREANFQEVEVGLQSVDPQTQRRMGRSVDLAAFERGASAMLNEGIRVRVDLILGLPGDTVDSFRRGIDYLVRVRPFSEIQVFNLSILPGTAFREEASELGLEYQAQPPYYVLRTPTMDVEQMYQLMDEAQEALGIEFDSPGPPVFGAGLPPLPQGPNERLRGTLGDRADSGCVVDLDHGPAVLPPPGRRALVFTLWLRSAEFDGRRQQSAELIARVLADNPHTTLQLVLEPAAEPRRLSPDTVASLWAACHQSLSYLDWYYSLHPHPGLGAKRLVVFAPWSKRARAGQGWIDAVGECAALVWWGGPADDDSLAEHEHLYGAPGGTASSLT